MYSPKQIADYFLSKHSVDGNITPMKLIKLVYIAHGWHLGITDTALIDENPEYSNKLGIVRGLWVNLGTFYKKLLLQKQTVTDKPAFFRLYIKTNGEITVHYIPNIVIFDVSRDKKFYKEKVAKLFHAFYGIEGNNLKEIQKEDSEQ